MIRRRTKKYRKIKRYFKGGKCKCSSTMTVTNSNNNNNNNSNKKPKEIPDMTKLLGNNASEEEIKARQEMAKAKTKDQLNSVMKNKLPDIDLGSLGQQLSNGNGAKDATKKAVNAVTNKLPGPLKGLAEGFADPDKLQGLQNKVGSIGEMAGPIAGKLGSFGSMLGKKGGKKKNKKTKKNRKNRKKKSKKLL